MHAALALIKVHADAGIQYTAYAHACLCGFFMISAAMKMCSFKDIILTGHTFICMLRWTIHAFLKRSIQFPLKSHAKNMRWFSRVAIERTNTAKKIPLESLMQTILALAMNTWNILQEMTKHICVHACQTKQCRGIEYMMTHAEWKEIFTSFWAKICNRCPHVGADGGLTSGGMPEIEKFLALLGNNKRWVLRTRTLVDHSSIFLFRSLNKLPQGGIVEQVAMKQSS